MKSVVCCIESGPLEPMTLRLVESVRRFGGAMRDSPVYAVQARRGPRPTRDTLRRLDQLGARYLHVQREDPFTWHQFTNKAYALVEVERIAETPLIAWFDSDMLVLDEPDALSLEPDAQFAACALEKGGIGSRGPDDPNDPYWAALCDAVGIDLDDLPWVTAKEESIRIRLYFNSGVFVYRRGTGLPEAFVESHKRFFAARIAHPKAGVHFLQPLLGLTVAKLGLRWIGLPHSHHFTVHGWPTFEHNPEELRGVKILHYHNAMRPHCFAELIACLSAHHPEAANWLKSLGPVENPAMHPARIVNQTLRASRAMRRRNFLRRCRMVQR